MTRRWVLGVVMIVAACRSHGESPAVRQAHAWLAAFSSQDRAKIAEFHAEHWKHDPGEDVNAIVDRELQFSYMTGGFVAKKLEQATATRATLVVREQDSEQFARLAMEVEDAEPHRVTKMQLEAIDTPDEFREPRRSEPEALAALRGELDRVVARDRFAGAVLIASRGKPIFAQAYGLADRERRVPNTLATQFRIGSMNKMFTATAVLQLVQAGKLAVREPLGEVVRDYPNAAVASKVTLHHLLTHTGGTGDIFGPEFDAHRLELRTHDDYVKLYGKRDLAFEPGARWDYSNYGFVLLGVVLERATGKSYYDAVHELVYAPAGMTATASEPEEAAVPARATGYTRRAPTEPWKPNTDTLPYRGTAAGGGYSTVGDLLRFGNALTGHVLLDADHTELLTRGKVDMGPGRKYAYGFGDTTSDGVRCVGHNGGAPGMNGDLEICDSGYTIVVLANLDPPAATRISDFIARRLPAHAP
ncbi:MAG: serine hydrolase domain-containing protein [Acidobacteriota bacterium]